MNLAELILLAIVLIAIFIITAPWVEKEHQSRRQDTTARQVTGKKE